MRVTAYDALGKVLHEWDGALTPTRIEQLPLVVGAYDRLTETAHRIVREDGFVLKDRSGPIGWPTSWQT